MSLAPTHPTFGPNHPPSIPSMPSNAAPRDASRGNPPALLALEVPIPPPPPRPPWLGVHHAPCPTCCDLAWAAEQRP
eukprot:13375144-Alexandrium_andersonii.AAC.1